MDNNLEISALTFLEHKAAIDETLASFSAIYRQFFNTLQSVVKERDDLKKELEGLREDRGAE